MMALARGEAAAYSQIAARSSGVKEALYFPFLPRLACLHASSRSNAALTAWFTSLRTFGDSCVERSSKRGVVTCNIMRLSMLAPTRGRVGNFPCLEWQACPRGRDIESLKCACETHAARVPSRFEF